MMQTTALPVTYFGKVPLHGDFVRRNASGGAVQALDAWLQKGLFTARSHLAGRLEAAYDQAGAWAFYFGPVEAGTVLIGVMQPSRDRVGRRFPFLVAGKMAAAAAPRLAHVPVQYHGFFEQAARVAREAASGALEHHALAEHTDPLHTWLEGHGETGALEQYLRTTTLVSLWERLWGHADDTRKYLLFKNLLDILQPLRQGIPRGFPLVLRFPLCPDEKTVPFDASFWLEVCCRLLNRPDLQPSFFWKLGSGSFDGTGAEPPSLLLTFSLPSASLFSYLMTAEVESDSLCVLEHLNDPNAALAALAIPDHYGQMLEADHLTLWDFLHRL